MVVPYRVVMMVVLCLGTINLYSQRMCLTIAVLCMTNHTASKLGYTEYLSNFSSQSKSVCASIDYNSQQELQDGLFVWDAATRGHVLGTFFWGYLVGQIPAGFIAQKFGARRVLFISLILLGLSTSLIPLAVIHSVYWLFVLRIISGLASATWFPGFYQVWASWAPPNERGLLVGLSYAGVHVGNALTLPIAGGLCQTSFGWPSVFYFYGASSLLYAFVWIMFVYNTPTEHPRISEQEKKLIVSVCGDSGRKRKRESHIPVLAMLRSLPVWAFVVVTIGYDWNGYTMLTSTPAYMREVLLFDINENAGLSALPYMGLWLGQLVSGWVSDKMLAKRVLSVSAIRKIMTAIGMYGPAMMMILISLFDCRYKYIVVGLFTLGLVLNSGVFAGGLLNPIEMSPNHAGIIFAGANTLSAMTGVLAPLMASVLTSQRTYEQWRYVFYLGAAIYVVSGTFFVCCSSSKVQSWAIGPKGYYSSEELYVQVLQDEVHERTCHSEPAFPTPNNALDTSKIALSEMDAKSESPFIQKIG